MKVRVYVDGFNLYYGALKARPASRWLDLAVLSRLLRPDDTIDAIRYFTARVKGDRDATAPGKQKLYLAALGTLPLVTVHFGQFRTHPVAMPLAKPGPGKRRTARVLKTEEKGSDVNLATYLLLDGLDDRTSRPWSSPMTLILRLRSGRRTVASAPSTSSVRVARHRRQLGRRRLIRCHTRDHSWTPLDPALLLAAQLPSPLRLPSGRSIHKPPAWA